MNVYCEMLFFVCLHSKLKDYKWECSADTDIEQTQVELYSCTVRTHKKKKWEDGPQSTTKMREDIGGKTISPLLLVLAVGRQSFERGWVTAATIQNSLTTKDKRGISGYGHWKSYFCSQ